MGFGTTSITQFSWARERKRGERRREVEGGRKAGQRTDVVGLTDYSIADPTKCLV